MIASLPPAESIARTLAPWRRRIRVARALQWCARGLGLGSAAAILALLVARFVPWADANTVAAASIGLGGFGGLVAGYLAPLSPRQVALVADWAAGLADRATTAWELREHHEPFALLQRADALARLRDADPRAVATRISRRDLAVLVALAGIVAIAALAPNPMLDVLRRQQAERARIQEAANEVKDLADRPAASSSPSTVDQAKIEQALRDLASQLEQTDDASSALAAVSRTEQSLRSQIPPGGEGAAASLSAEARALQQNALARPLGDALGAKDTTALARATQALQSALAKLTPEQRSAVARALQEAANAGRDSAAGADAQLANASLRAAAQAIQQGDLSEASAQLGAAQSALGEQISASQTTDAILRTISGLDSARDTINGAAAATSTPGPARSSQGSQSGQTGIGQTDAGAGQGQPGTDQTGVETGQGQASSGQANAANSSSGSGSAQGSGTSDQANNGANGRGTSGANGAQPGGTGGRGTGGGRSAALPGKSTPGDQVYIPGQASGGEAIQQAGPAGPGLGAEVPYQQVIGQYAQNAREHLDHRDLPPDVRDLVRKYFVGLEEGSSQ